MVGLPNLALEMGKMLLLLLSWGWHCRFSATLARSKSGHCRHAFYRVGSTDRKFTGDEFTGSHGEEDGAPNLVIWQCTKSETIAIITH
ncbi:hypothetical protein ACLOJK_010512 [Asimina triloba]